MKAESEGNLALIIFHIRITFTQGQNRFLMLAIANISSASCRCHVSPSYFTISCFSRVIGTIFETGVLLFAATFPMGTNTFVSGK